MNDFLNDLNEQQRAAVEYIDGPQLVIAGAGSGKTRVLTYKIAYLLTQGIKPWEIMALTFTNKAAREMRERIAALVGEKTAQYLRMGTFHSQFSHLLRRQAEAVGITSNYTIYDQTDSRTLIKAIIKELGLNDKVYRAADVQNRISMAKNDLLTADDYADDGRRRSYDTDKKMPDVWRIYNIYENRCHGANALDFDDLLLRTFLLLRDHQDICQQVAASYRYYLVDEYQDTNYAQQQILLRLTTAHKNICVVGDDAQSIYGFRGAKIDNILGFQRDYTGAKLYKLEANYRSTAHIVDAANSLIAKNTERIPKDVVAIGPQGDRIHLVQCVSDREETMFASSDIKARMAAESLTPADFAVLYRTNSQSRMFEEQFKKDGLPYQVYGGMSFYQRKEIKDIVAYLRLIVNPDDEEAFRRIVNYPARGIGATTVERLLSAAHAEGNSPWQQLESLPDTIAAAAARRLKDFRQMIRAFQQAEGDTPADALTEQVLRLTGITAELQASDEPEVKSKRENMEGFLSQVAEFVATARETGEDTSLATFLQDVALLTDKDEDTDDDTPRVTLMTVHSAKGLEFPCVYIVGMEDDLFPSPLSADSPRKIEEERRLFYVAITRAARHCIITYATRRYRYGQMTFGSPSRFIRDIDRRLITAQTTGGVASPPHAGGVGFRPHAGRLGFRPSAPLEEANGARGRKPTCPACGWKATPPATSPATTTYPPGATVHHDRFGRGTVVASQGQGQEEKVIVDFDNAGRKTLLLKFARLTII